MLQLVVSIVTTGIYAVMLEKCTDECDGGSINLLAPEFYI